MLAFLIGTTILNLFLGYALAVYLMRASQDAEYRPQPRPADRSSTSEQASGLFADPTTSSANSTQTATDNQAATTAAAGGTTTEQAASGQTPSASTATATAGAASTTATAGTGEDGVARADGSEELDQQLLAGIADFRSQLAKLRSETGQPEEGKRRPVARK
ncbi:hypothetical protein [Lacipirellula parvula]|uniref:Uncharacterized protein n=1 Tax=Lacipirellula parvula TaxID=2650471 RepID=A0A5K7X381_9BACT|nr:hypothetical protein [Lacipirellula parvula]BBO31114.1 hypothetical protein PLANPX_0726 [Lacipirellula parvula]